MLYAARLVYLAGAAIAAVGIVFLVLLVGRRSDPLIDAPEFIPLTIGAMIFGVGIVFVAQVMGNDLAPHLPGYRPAGRAPAPAAPPAPRRAETVQDYNEQVVTRHLQGDTSIDIDMFDDAVHGRLRPPSRSDAEIRRDAEIASLDLAGHPVRLQVLVPPEPSDSWVGGNPSMPADMPWPESGGKPAKFYAQIACHHLPPKIWGWQGPRAGWLLIFGPEEGAHHGNALVVHTTELGQERPRPYGQVFRYYQYGAYDDIAQLMMGDAGLQPPKWPVRVVPTTEGARPAEVPDRNAKDGFNTQDPGWEPFDWETLVAWIAEVIWMTEKSRKLRFKLPEDLADEVDPKDLTAGVQRVLVDLRKLEAAVQEAKAAAPYDPELRDAVLAAVKNLSFTDLDRRDGEFFGMKQTHPHTLLINSDYAALHDMRARHVYTRDPSALPPAVRDLLVPQWQAVAEDEIITMGGDTSHFEQEGAASILELVPSRLFSWTFGDYSNFAILLRADDLLDGHWDKAFAVDNHGL